MFEHVKHDDNVESKLLREFSNGRCSYFNTLVMARLGRQSLVSLGAKNAPSKLFEGRKHHPGAATDFQNRTFNG
jgi:hypothetical protein